MLANREIATTIFVSLSTMFTDQKYFFSKKVSHVVQRGRRPIPEQLAPSHPKEDGWEEKKCNRWFLSQAPQPTQAKVVSAQK